MSVFLQEEKSALLPLPRQPYELSTWKIATVQFNYHISVDSMLYSVPYEYINHKVDVRVTKNTIEVFFNDQRICSHMRLYGRQGQYSTNIDHMPENHRNYTTWNSQRFISWAESVGSNTTIVVKSILSTHRVEQQGYRSCMALLKMGDKYSLIRLEAACEKALTYTSTPNFKSVQTILKTGQDKIIKDEQPSNSKPKPQGFTRGAEYYGRNS